MQQFIIYHNPRCSKSRQSLALLIENNIQPDIIDYQKKPLTINELKKLVAKLSINVVDLLRKSDCKKVEFDWVNQSSENIFKALHKYPKLMERPIVEYGEVAVIGRPIENVESLIKKSTAHE